MSVTTDRLRAEEDALDHAVVVDDGPGTPSERDQDTEAGDDPPPLRIPMVAAAAALSTAGAAWMVAGLFRGGVLPYLLAFAGVAVGVGVAAASYRYSRGNVLQYAVLPAAALLGAAAVAPAAPEGATGLPGLVADALRSGGLLQPPVPLEPGWRFLLVVIPALVGAATLAVAVGLRRPSAAALLPAPVTVGAALVHGDTSGLTTTLAGAFLTVAALAVAYGADLASQGATSGSFETRRLARGAGLLALLVAGAVAVAQAGFLFPDTDDDRVVPPQKPPVPPAEPDRVIFRVESEERGPWRVGTLDVYDGEAFLLPPLDPSRLRPVASGERVAERQGATRQVTFEILDVRGRSLPVPASPVAVSGEGSLDYDPRTQTLLAREGRPSRGFRYTVEALELPDGAALAEAPPPDPAVAAEFAAVPPPPNEVVELLREAPENAFDRLQFVRQRLYDTVVAAGAGRPVDLPPARVAALLRDGAEATPYEISAAEVLLARWAGVPARLGFGYFGGEEAQGGLEFRPRHGAAFLEAYFEGHGWIPVVGTPPRAKSSLSDEERNDDPAVVATDELGFVLYVPVELSPLTLLYEAIRYWAARAVPVLLLGGLLVAGYPAALKALRTWRRRRWALAGGTPARIWAAYAEMRDKLYDLNVGDVRHTPLAFLDAVDADAEHEQLAWLVTRGMWGDLRRDLRPEDAEAAEDMARSVAKRVAVEQTLLNRVLAAASRTSLRDPYSVELPNTWWNGSPRARLRRAVGRTRSKLRPPSPGWRLRPAAGVMVLVVAAGLTMTGCAEQAGFEGARAALRFPDPLAPEEALGYRMTREPDIEKGYATAGDEALVSGGRVFTIRGDDTIEGSLQVAMFKPGVDAGNPSVQRSVERGLGAGRFRTRYHGTVRLRELVLTEQRLVLWFPPDENVMQLFVLRRSFDDGMAVVRAVVDHQLGVTEEVS